MMSGAMRYAVSGRGVPVAAVARAVGVVGAGAWAPGALFGLSSGVGVGIFAHGAK